MVTATDSSATQYVFDITSKLLLVHILLIIIVFFEQKCVHVAPLGKTSYFSSGASVTLNVTHQENKNTLSHSQGVINLFSEA